MHLRICVLCVWPVPKKTPKNKQYTKDTIRWEQFLNDLLLICLFVSELKKSQPEAVIFLAHRQICKYAKEQVETGFLRWCLLRTCELHRVFVATQTTGAQIHICLQGSFR